MKLLTLLLCATFFIAFTVHAQTDTSEFSIRIFGGADAEAPTTPTLTSATAITETQVDLAWTAATDNYAVSGYVVFRDSTAIATTTQLTYSDTGVLASTSYSYFVQAFDASGNYSSSSNSLAVTTPDYPPPPIVATTSSQGEGTVARVVADEVRITPGYSTSSVYIKTPFPARFEIRWGRTASYELGYVVSDIFQKEYRTLITDLEPGTVYEYQIIGYTRSGAENIVKQGRFTTLSSFDVLPPANVSQFSATGEGSNVRLNWKLPTSDDIAYVRIVRSHLGFPLNPSDGAVVYQGTGEGTLDANILSRYSPVYYTAFVFDSAGNVSSGAVARVYATSVNGDEVLVVGGEDDAVPLGTNATSSATTFDDRLPEMQEIFVIQGTTMQTFFDTELRLLSTQPFLLSIPKNAVANGIKSIIVTLKDPTDNRKEFSFLLRINKQQTAYEAVLSPIGVTGTTAIMVDIYNFETYIVGSYVKNITFLAERPQERLMVRTEEKESLLLWQFLGGVFGLLLFYIWFLLGRRKRDEDKKDEVS